MTTGTEPTLFRSRTSEHSESKEWFIPYFDQQVASHLAYDGDRMALSLPKELAEDEDGAIRLAGHRITFFVFVDFLKSSKHDVTVKDVQMRFPTVATETIVRILYFYATNLPAVQHYYYKHLRIAESNRQCYQDRGPNVEALRTRWQMRRSSQQ